MLLVEVCVELANIMTETSNMLRQRQSLSNIKLGRCICNKYSKYYPEVFWKILEENRGGADRTILTSAYVLCLDSLWQCGC